MLCKKLILLTIVYILSWHDMKADAQDGFKVKGVLVIQGEYGLVDLPNEIGGVNFDCSKAIKISGLKTDIKSIVKSFKDINRRELQSTDFLLNNFNISDDKLICLFIKYHVNALDKIIRLSI